MAEEKTTQKVKTYACGGEQNTPEGKTKIAKAIEIMGKQAAAVGGVYLAAHWSNLLDTPAGRVATIVPATLAAVAVLATDDEIIKKLSNVKNIPTKARNFLRKHKDFSSKIKEQDAMFLSNARQMKNNQHGG